ncbi:chaperone of endosialidase [Lentimicrobium saccharophilum]|uniref:Chaperone of endosialidase n=1 Tax=Lentimicrobium saccharophilum TaxID=1678841 RepID=A0A0S7C0G4_9BACT|nr:tail fiber domain-containing protein [Lentimicrobium saccharophilum]GAP43986.1 chaperone of endosialidase [Lentimicrobium saccharophilum]
MKKISILILMLLLQGSILLSQVAINIDGSLPDNSAMLDVQSTSKGLLIPQMSMAQRNSILLPAPGLLVFQNDATAGFYYNAGSRMVPNWKLVGSNAGPWLYSGTTIYYNAGNVGIGTSSPAARFHVANGDALINGLTVGRGPWNIANNTVLGMQALQNGDAGTGITAIGAMALANATEQSDLVAVGDSALYNNGLNAVQSYHGTENTAVGPKSLYSNTTGFWNTALGYRAMYANTGGYYNTAVGHRALECNTTGYQNTACGFPALKSNTQGERNAAFGSASLQTNTIGNYNSAFGYATLYSNTTGSSNVAIGLRALYSNTDRSDLVAIGDSALYNNGLNVSASYHATSNTAIGSNALYSNTVGYSNTAIGSGALYSNTYGYYNTAIGSEALYSDAYGCYNTALGYEALEKLGTYASGYGNCAIGYRSLEDLSDGSNNTAIGRSSLSNLSSGEDNVAVGDASGPYQWAGTSHCSRGTMLGVAAGVSQDFAENFTALGYYAEVDASYQVRIGNDNVTSIGGYTGWTTLTTDESYQFNVRENVAGLDFILKLRPVTYQMDVEKLADFRSKRRKNRPDSLENEKLLRLEAEGRQQKSMEVYSGFVAQEVEKAALETGYDFSGLDVPKSESGLYGLRYAEFVVPLVKGMQEQQAIIENQQKQIDELLKRIKELEAHR